MKFVIGPDIPAANPSRFRMALGLNAPAQQRSRVENRFISYLGAPGPGSGQRMSKRISSIRCNRGAHLTGRSMAKAVRIAVMHSLGDRFPVD